MAEAIPGFSPEESDVLRQAFDAGKLTDEEKQWIVDQVGKAASATEGNASALGVQDQTPSFGQRSLEAFSSRDTAVALGGTAGAILGTATAGPVLGTIAGGGLGAAAGSALFDNFHNLKAYLDSQPEKIVGAQEVTKNMIGEGMTDAAFSMGGAVAQPIRLGRMAIAKISGLNEKAAAELMLIAENAGIRLGAVDVGGTFPKGYAKTIGVFPFSGTPFRRGEVQKLQDANKAINRILDTFAPNEKLAGEIGMDMYKAAQESRQEFRTVAGGLYDHLRELIETAKNPNIIPTDDLRALAIEHNDLARRGQIILNDGTFLPSVQSAEIADFFLNVSRLPELIKPTQYERLTEDLKTLIGKNLKEGFDVKQLAEAKKALREGFDNLRTDLLDPGEGDAIKTALQQANKFYSDGIVKFQTPAAKIFERVNRFIFKAGADQPGTLNPDEIYHTALNLRSPEQVKDLTKLVGIENMQNAARENFRTAVEAARSDVVILGKTFSAVDPNVLEKKLGLVGAGTKKLEGLRELYKTSGVDLDEVKNLIEVMKKIEGIGNPAEFMRRRIILGGIGGAAGALGIGGAVMGGTDPADAAGTGIITGVALTLLGRHGSEIFASPEKLKLITGALDEARGAIPQRANLSRLINLLSGNKDQVVQTPLSEEVM